MMAICLEKGQMKDTFNQFYYSSIENYYVERIIVFPSTKELLLY